jgi:DNA-binding response OmpR family regulator
MTDARCTTAFLAHSAQETRGGNALRVLWVDDDPVVVSSSKLRLGSSGIDVTWAYSGIEGLRLAQARAYDLVILDQRMPELSGLDVLALLRVAENRIPVMFLTAYATQGLERDARSLGAVTFHQKPLTGSALVSAIHAAASTARKEEPTHRSPDFDESLRQREEIARLRYLLSQLEDVDIQRRELLIQEPPPTAKPVHRRRHSPWRLSRKKTQG